MARKNALNSINEVTSGASLKEQTPVPAKKNSPKMNKLISVRKDHVEAIETYMENKDEGTFTSYVRQAIRNQMINDGLLKEF